MTLDQYDEMLSQQGGKCAICRTDNNQIIRGKLAPLHIDHDHLTGKIRGLLCGCCNTALGKFRDDEDILTRAIAYLSKNRVIS